MSRHEITILLKNDLPDRPEDIDEIERCTFQKALSGYDILNYMSRHGGMGLVTDDGDIVGYLAYQIEDSGTCMVTRCAVHPDFRQKGLATKMFHRLTQEILPIRLVELDIHYRNTLGKKFFKKLGFKYQAREGNWLRYAYLVPGIKTHVENLAIGKEYDVSYIEDGYLLAFRDDLVSIDWGKTIDLNFLSGANVTYAQTSTIQRSSNP